MALSNSLSTRMARTGLICPDWMSSSSASVSCIPMLRSQWSGSEPVSPGASDGETEGAELTSIVDTARSRAACCCSSTPSFPLPVRCSKRYRTLVPLCPSVVEDAASWRTATTGPRGGESGARRWTKGVDLREPGCSVGFERARIRNSAHEISFRPTQNSAKPPQSLARLLVRAERQKCTSSPGMNG